MKSIVEYINEAIVNEAGRFNFSQFEQQLKKVEKLFKDEDKFNEWCEDEIGNTLPDWARDNVAQILDYARDLKDECKDNFEDEGENYNSFDDLAYVDAYWCGIWSSLADDFGPDAEEVGEIVNMLWYSCTKKSFPFSLDC